MDSEIAVPLVLSALYLGALAFFSEIVERTPCLVKWARHPFVYALALGVYATAWTLFGSVGFAHHFGHGFMAISLGVALSCLAIPVIWRPLGRVVRRHGFGSVADLLSFRFQSQAVGAVVTCFLVAALLPYIALQVRAILDAAEYLNGGSAPAWVGVAYACLMGAFAAGLGVRYANPRQQRPGLLATLAAESIFKLVAILLVGTAVLYSVFGGFGGLEEHLARHPEKLAAMTSGVTEGPWAALMVASFFAAFLLPRQFHIAYVEHQSAGAMRHLIWILPLFLLLVNLPLPVLFWAGQEVAPHTVPDLWVLATPESTSLRLLAFLGGLSAATAMLLISTIALSGMVMNHLVLPVRGPRGLEPSRLTGIRRMIVLLLVFAGFGLHWVLPRSGSLVDLGLVSFVAVLQLAPGVLAVLWWPRATRRGMLMGLTGGGGAWLLIAAVPLLKLGDNSLVPAMLGFEGADPRSSSLWISIGVNLLLFTAGSLIGPMRDDESAAAAACAWSGRPLGRASTGSIAELYTRLVATLGEDSAKDEMARALDELDLDEAEARPLALRRLAQRLERNLSELVGPMQARGALDIGKNQTPNPDLTAEIAFLNASDDSLPPAGIGRSVERVRRYLAAVLNEMPIGVCTLGTGSEVAVWNKALAEITGIEADAAVGAVLTSLPGEWGTFLAELITKEPSAASEANERFIGDRWVVGRATHGEERVTITVQDRTAQQNLQMQVLHQDRLASVGRLAAGIAHEIGNPLSGLTMVAQNLAREPDAEDAAERLEIIVSEASRIAETIESMLAFTRREEQAKAHGPVSIDAVVRDALRLVKIGGGRKKAIRFVVDVPDDVHVTGSLRALSQLVVNLVENAIDASPDDGEVSIVARCCRDSELDLIVSDQGDGLDTEIDQIFDPFFTTKGVGEGTGLGLSIAYWIANNHGASIVYERRDRRTCFMVRGLQSAVSRDTEPLSTLPQ